MSLIGGYFCRSGKRPDDVVRRKLHDFAILGGDSPDAYEHTVRPFRFGHILAKHKRQGPVQVRGAEAGDISLLTLGFHDLDYEAVGANCAVRIEESEGEFVSLLLDRKADAVHIINDRFSARPFYWLQEGDVTAFSSNLLFLVDLLDLRCKADVLGWLEIFSYSHTLAERTHVEGIRRLLPARHLTISKAGADCRAYWRLKHETQHGLDPVEHAERTFDAMRRSTAARARLSGAGFVSLSGGLDSRLVAGALPAESNFYLYTFGSDEKTDSADVQAAQQIARILGREHCVERLDQRHISSVAEDATRLTGGLTTLQHPAKTFGNLREMVAGPGFKMGGGPGDSLAGAFASGSIHNISRAMRDRQIGKFIFHRKKLSAGVLRHIWRREVVEAHYPLLDDCMEACFSELSGETAAHCLSAWAMVFRQPAFTFSSPIHNHPDVTEASPHLGYDYVDCMLQLPAEWIYQKNFYKFMIRHCLPELGDVVYANTGKTLPTEIQRYAVPPRKRICAAIERCIPAVPLEAYRQSRAKPSSQETPEYLLLRRDKTLLQHVREMLHSFSALREMLDVAGCDAFLRSFEEGSDSPLQPAYQAEIAGGLATMCYWQKCIAR
ncbi:MAG: hypothetical protein IH624_18410 [Phycisphaerae bacterium]|nr:hypothetical protein [Phycisphaerae bacterium]